MNAEQIWQAALGELQLQITRATFDTWVKDTRAISYEDGTFLVAVRNGYTKDWLENRLLSTIKRTLVGIVGRSVEVRFIVWNPEAEQEEPVALLRPPDSSPPSPPRQRQKQKKEATSQFNPRYTFETFVVGNSNRLAHAASLAVVERPATAYNPLFLYGGVGLGKTHLLHAIGWAAQQRGLRALYVSSESFTNDLINSIRTQNTEQFREKYRSTDVLLVDDIQFIAGKESTQEEFFHTFNTLHGAGKQIVISSDRPPKAILTLEERLRSRFEWGLIADIQPPDLETRIAILRFKAERQPIPVPDAVLDLIAHQVHSNIRELEGALNAVLARAQLMRQPLTVELAQQALRDLLPRTEHRTPEEIIATVAKFYGLKVEDLTGKKRHRSVVRPRQIAMFLAREETNASLPQIGRALGGRDHTTILHGYEKIADLLERDEALRRELLSIKERLYRNNKT